MSYVVDPDGGGFPPVGLEDLDQQVDAEDRESADQLPPEHHPGDPVRPVDRSPEPVCATSPGLGHHRRARLRRPPLADASPSSG